MTPKGIIAAGHPETAAAAAVILEEGGNAFDAVLAALSAACVAEPVLASLGGGGFLLARPAAGHTQAAWTGPARLYDFFTQTPKSRTAPGETDFFPIFADFGMTTQEFHIGMGAMATPGVVRGLFKIHRDLCSMPMERIVEPAIGLARKGVRINTLQAYIFQVVSAVYAHGNARRELFGAGANAERLVGEGDVLSLPNMADTLESLAKEGPDLFYRGDIAHALVEDSRTHGGTLNATDLEDYRVEKRAPLELEFGGNRLYTNPPPSTGGLLIGFALELLKDAGLREAGFGSVIHLERLVNAMGLTNKARLESGLDDSNDLSTAILDPGFLAAYRKQVFDRPSFLRGTTHISIIDALGNAASMTVSNGEGCGYVIPGTGIMMNNMLGEDDIQPMGFHRWKEDTRISSMMAPTIAMRESGQTLALGSGGSNRIRTSILQVLLNLLEFRMSVGEAVDRPRVHFENGLLSMEPGFEDSATALLREAIPKTNIWADKNLFFGGVHTVLAGPDTGQFNGAGDSRRGGVTVTV